MKKALSCKIVLLFIAFALSIALAFSFYSVKTVRAADITVLNISDYFGGSYKSVEMKDDNLVLTVEDGGSVSVVKELVIDDMAIELNVPDTVSSFKITLKYASYFVGGAYDAANDEFDKTIENEFEFTDNGDLTVLISTEDNVVSVKVGNNEESKADAYYRIKGEDKCAANISFEFDLEDASENAEIAFKSIDQKASDVSGDYKQTFVLEDDKVATIAKPRVSISSMPVAQDAYGSLRVVFGDKKTFDFTAYSLFGSVTSSSVYIDKTTAGEGIKVDAKSATPKYIVFENTGAAALATFSVRTSDIENIEEYTVLTAVSLEDYEELNQAPYYIAYAGNEDIYENYAKAVQKAATKDYDEYGVHSIRLGDTYQIPSLQDLVGDDYDIYSDLSYTVYYKTPTTSSSTSALSFTVSQAGEYEFYVVFKDKAGKAMEKEDFYTVDEDDDQVISEEGPYINAVFKFTVDDDAPISVEAPASQGNGYLNTRYVASSFKIQSSGNNVKYTLYYNAKLNATAEDSGWVEIPAASEVSEGYSAGGFDYDDIKEINYDGSYTFTPIKKGSYKIDCNVVSVNQERSASDYSIITISQEPTVVKVDDHWFQKNVWSIVFLSIGTLSLIGIVVLLFVKPKEETEKDETGDALKVDAKK